MITSFRTIAVVGAFQRSKGSTGRNKKKDEVLENKSADTELQRRRFVLLLFKPQLIQELTERKVVQSTQRGLRLL